MFVTFGGSWFKKLFGFIFLIILLLAITHGGC